MRVSGGEQVEAVVYICFRSPASPPVVGHANLSASVLLGSPRARSRPRVGGLVAGRWRSPLPGTSPPALGDLHFPETIHTVESP